MTADEHLDRFLARVADRTARIALIGQGYVGLPVSMRAAEQGFPVIGFEVSPSRLADLRAGRSYVEDIPAAQLQAALARDYVPTDSIDDLRGFDAAIISVPTPLREGAPDLSFVESASRTLAKAMTPGCVVVLESTTYPGTTEELVLPILEESGLKAGDDFFLGYSPERIDPGNRSHTFVNTPKVVSGCDPRSRRAVEALYGALVDRVVSVSSTGAAELVKLLENTFRHVNIALINELAMFARELGVDVWEAIDAATTKPFGYMRFTPGPGVGGHCLPIDPSYLSWQVKRRSGHPFRFVELANDVNDHMPDYVIRRVTAQLNREGRAVNGTKILLLGLTYKAGTSDWRESPSRVVAEGLLAMGAHVQACDPHVPQHAVSQLAAPVVPFEAANLAAADLVIVLVDHPEFDPALIAGHARLVFDAKNLLRGHTFRGEVI
jgi:UDP-N-acetyl-D-glucosamine dehydrogenase